MKDLPGQTALYTVSADEQLRLIREAKKRKVDIKVELHKNHEIRKLLRVDYVKACDELDRAEGGENLQMRIAEIKQEESTQSAVITSRETSQSVLAARRKRVEQGAVRTLKAAGGLLSNKDLASLLNQEEHGLSGLLTECAELEKITTGRIGNDVVSWKLKEMPV